MTVYTVLFTTLLGQKATISNEWPNDECSGCQPDSWKPGPITAGTSLNAQAIQLLPALGPTAVLKFGDRATAARSLTQAASSAAAGCLSVTVDGMNPGHCVMVLFWNSDPGRAQALDCGTCPPGNSALVQWLVPDAANALHAQVSALQAPMSVYVYNFYSAAAADAWISSPEGAIYLKGAVYTRLTLAP